MSDILRQINSVESFWPQSLQITKKALTEQERDKNTRVPAKIGFNPFPYFSPLVVSCSCTRATEKNKKKVEKIKRKTISLIGAWRGTSTKTLKALPFWANPLLKHRNCLREQRCSHRLGRNYHHTPAGLSGEVRVPKILFWVALMGLQAYIHTGWPRQVYQSVCWRDPCWLIVLWLTELDFSAYKHVCFCLFYDWADFSAYKRLFLFVCIYVFVAGSTL